MNAIIVCLSAAVLGVDYGWQPVAGGGIEYIIQIEPELLDSLKAGHDLFSDLPPATRDIRSYRITVGRDRLPHHGEPPPTAADAMHAGSLSDASTETTAPAAEVDLSQLPGPILGPALILQPPGSEPDGGEPDGGESNGGEPPRLVEDEAKPLANRVAGYHGKPSLAETEDDQQAALKNEHAVQSHSSKKNEPHSGVVAGSVADGQEQRAAQTSAPPTEAGSAVMQLGLCASLCGNVFLLWVVAGQRSSYRALVRRVFERRTEELAALPPPPSSSPQFEQAASESNG